MDFLNAIELYAAHTTAPVVSDHLLDWLGEVYLTERLYDRGIMFDQFAASPWKAAGLFPYPIETSEPSYGTFHRLLPRQRRIAAYLFNQEIN